MEQSEDRFHKRKNPRLSRYDYTQPGYYFVTICTKDKRCIFGSPGQLNRYGQIALQKLEEISNHFPEVRLDKYVVMPNHIHAVIVLNGVNTDLSVVIGQYKSAVTKTVRGINGNMEIWQTSFHDHVIRNQPDYQRIWGYIDTNPMRWQEDCFFIEQSG